MTIEYGEPQNRFNRYADEEPHWGGAAISENPAVYRCTSAFGVGTNDGFRGSVTAGHCHDAGVNLFSGPEYYGATDLKYDYPTFDMVRIAGNGETYEPVIYTDPGNPWRDVVGAYTVTVGMQVCVSGRVTGAVCAITVVNTDYQWCGNPFGCTTWTFLARKSGQLVGQGGDSGAPVYTRPGATTADIHGMEIAGDSFDEMICEHVGFITDHLGVGVLYGLALAADGSAADGSAAGGSAVSDPSVGTVAVGAAASNTASNAKKSMFTRG